MGGLGNLLFQIANVVSLAIDNDWEYGFNLDQPIQCRTHYYDRVNVYKDTIFWKVPHANVSACVNEYKEPYFHFKKINCSNNSILTGYFQSDKYFKHNELFIKNLFELPSETNEYITSKYGNLFTEETIGIHVRRGDYLETPQFHLPLTPEYYFKGLDLFPKNTKKIIVSDDVPWCKSVFGDSAVYIEGEKDFIDMNILSRCSHNIIANSSFSWWGAYLNKNKDKKVVFPATWFGPANRDRNISDLYWETSIKL